VRSRRARRVYYTLSLEYRDGNRKWRVRLSLCVARGSGVLIKEKVIGLFLLCGVCVTTCFLFYMIGPPGIPASQMARGTHFS